MICPTPQNCHRRSALESNSSSQCHSVRADSQGLTTPLPSLSSQTLASKLHLKKTVYKANIAN